MSSIPLDTTPGAHALQYDAYRRLGGSERVGIMFRLTALVNGVAMAGIQSRHPDYTADDVRAALARLTLGDRLASAAWPDRPLIDP